ncbi:alpha/beta hydrolase family protein [Enemella dayhoffiae]|uniref:alpha/beta hydrolase family protein n=1 Tax=Enemella dayhoffiae TaxID=2016507 RepID=UPI001140519C|nr:alpha/beta fold hydrolase [Enemella dayhoffiae]
MRAVLISVLALALMVLFAPVQDATKVTEVGAGGLGSEPMGEPADRPTVRAMVLGKVRRAPVRKSPPLIRPAVKVPQPKTSLAQTRAALRTQLIADFNTPGPPPEPPAGVFERITYPSQVGDLSAYLTPLPDRGKHPAVIWLGGGDTNTIGDVWSDQPADKDMTGAAFRRAGVTMMVPSLRGANGNPGRKEMNLGEVDDVLAAADFLAAQPTIDPKRIYLVGYSTGGGLALLTSESTDRFRAVFCFGPVWDVRDYRERQPYDQADQTENRPRSPGYWLEDVRSPIWVIEGGDANTAPTIRRMRKATKNPMVYALIVAGRNHFSQLDPVNRHIASDILLDPGTGVYRGSLPELPRG